MPIYFKLNKFNNLHFLDVKYLFKKIYWKSNNMLQKRKNIIEKKNKKIFKKYILLKLIHIFYVLKSSIRNFLLFFNHLCLQYNHCIDLCKMHIYKQSIFIIKHFHNKMKIFNFNKYRFFDNFLNIKKKNYFKFMLNELYFFYIKKKHIFNLN